MARRIVSALLIGAVIFAGTYAMSLLEGWKMHIGVALSFAAAVAVYLFYLFSKKEAP